MHPDIPTKAPDVVNMLRAWDMNIDRYQAVGKWRFENTDASINNTALWWLNTNVAVWSKWVTADAADAIKDALEAKEIPEGWPTQ